MLKTPRLFGWIVVTLILLAAVAALQPQQALVTLYKLSSVTLGGVIGYWLDRAVFPYARPDQIKTPNFVLDYSMAMLRRAIIMAASMIACALGA